MSNYYLIDLNHNKIERRMVQLYMTAAQIALKCGGKKNGKLNYTENNIREFWKYDDPYPGVCSFLLKVKVKNIKWFIQNHIESTNDIWNADFLHGMAKNGDLEWHKYRYPTLVWLSNDNLVRLAKAAPFGGTFGKNFEANNPYHRYRWAYVPAFYMKYSEESLSFMAGVLSGGEVFRYGDNAYVKYTGKTMPYLKKWGIPIEFQSNNKNGNYVLISPIWPALFSLKMPQEVSNLWYNIDESYEAKTYAAILWKTYIGHMFISGGIPYLEGRRTIFYKYRGEGLKPMKYLEMLRIKKGLTELDMRIREMVQMWANNKKDKQ